jgi:hypothetical protein
MADRRNRKQFEFEPSPDRFSGGMRRALYADPSSRSEFDYEDVGERYPIKPLHIREREMEEMAAREEDLGYRKTMLDEKLTEINLKKAQRDLDLYESRIAKEDAMLEQVPLARQELGALDPRSPDYLQQRMNVVNKYPVAFEYAPFVEAVDKPLLFRHRGLKEARVEAGEEVTEDEFNKATLILSDTANRRLVEKNDPAAIMRARVAYDTANKFWRQRYGGTMPAQEGMDMEENTMQVPQGAGQRMSLDAIFTE